MKKHLLITFDYELFLGPKSGYSGECLIAPTNVLRSILNPYGIKAIFFVDTTYLITLEKYAESYPRCKSDLENISAQIRDLILDGHYVFPHIHSHWLDADYDPGDHQFSLTKVARYRFHNITESEREMLFRESIRILSDIIHPVSPEYEINGYRAGGWSLQPFDDYKPYFEKFNIRYDFSVMPGLYQFSNAQYFDFSDAPRKPIYHFSEEVTKEDQDGPFTEVGSSVIRIRSHISFFHRLQLQVLYRILKDHTYGRGVGQQSKNIHDLKPNSVKGFDTNDKKYEAASAESLSIAKLPSYLRYIHENEYLCFVSHPKMLSGHNLVTLRRFLRLVSKMYNLETDFRHMVEYFCGEVITGSLEKDIIINKNTEPAGDIRISVIMPSYNVEEYIDEGLRSILNQTYAPKEIIVIDDGSTDRTRDIIRSLQAEFPDRIQLLVNDRNRGATYTRNRGLAVATGEYIQFFDADDLMLPHKFEYQVSVLKNAKVRPDILVGSCKKLFLDGTEKTYIYQPQDPWCALLDAMLGVTSSNLFRREKLLDVNGWSEALKSSQEYDLMFRMLKKGATVLFDQEIINVNRERAFGSITKTNPAEKWKRFINLRTRIFEYLRDTDRLTPEIRQMFVNSVFDAIRILYLYDPVTAKGLHNRYVKGIGKPRSTMSTSNKYLTFYKLFGFHGAQMLSAILNSKKVQTVH